MEGDTAGMNFDLTDEQSQVRDMVREFAQREVAPHIREWDAEGKVDRSLMTSSGKPACSGSRYRKRMGGWGWTMSAWRLPATNWNTSIRRCA
jgi:alkylation response protein AidB-like acyl-CoA dehydrogenase